MYLHIFISMGIYIEYMDIYIYNIYIPIHIHNVYIYINVCACLCMYINIHNKIEV